jgi:hypothetical protein
MGLTTLLQETMVIRELSWSLLPPIFLGTLMMHSGKVLDVIHENHVEKILIASAG